MTTQIKRNTLKLTRYMHLNVTGLLVVLTILSGFVLKFGGVQKVEARVDTTDIYGANACTFTATNVSTHTISINPGSSTTNAMRTRLTTICSDAPSFEVFAIGYSNNSSGNTKLIGQNGGGNISTATSGSSSRWSMKIAKDTSSYLPASMTIENSFGSNHVVPSSTTLIASYGTNTDTTTGASVIASYNVSIANGQMADSYIGKVKYSIVAAEPLPDCPAGYICYDPNSASALGTMNPGTYTGDTTSTKGYQTATTGSKVVLQAPNYKLTGYGFAGWNTKEDGTGTIYGPNQVITVPDVSSEGLMLYATWVASAGNFQTWQGCSSLTPVSYNSSTGTVSATLASVTALTDTRNNQTYAVARLADENCWIIENLRFGGTSVTVNATNTNNPGLDNLNYSTSTSTPWCTTNSQSCAEQVLLNSDNTTQGPAASTYSTSGPVYAYGNYYNRYAATTARGSYYIIDGNDAEGDICPYGWHLPSTNGSELDTIGYLSKQLGGGYGTISNTTIVDRLTSFPNNFVLAGYIYTGIVYRGTNGMYESATSAGQGSTYAYNYYMTNGINNRLFRTGLSMSSVAGFTVRCMRPSAKQVTDLTYMQDISTLSAVDFAGVWNSMIEDSQYQLKDRRDNKDYWISKEKDGNIWMTQNLDLNLSSSVTLYHATTDLGWGSDNTTSWRPSNSTISVSYAANNAINSWVDSTTAPYSLDVGNYYWDSSKWSNTSYDGLYYLGYNYGSPAQFATSPWTSSNGTHGHVGNYYNWPAAIASNNAGTYIYDTDTYPNSGPQNSICPAGWRLPKAGANYGYNGASNGSELGYLASIWIDLYGLSSDFDSVLVGAPVYMVRAGELMNNGNGFRIENAGNVSESFWTASTQKYSWDTVALPRIDHFWWGNYFIGQQGYDGAGAGYSVRCLVRQELFN